MLKILLISAVFIEITSAMRLISMNEREGDYGMTLSRGCIEFVSGRFLGVLSSAGG